MKIKTMILLIILFLANNIIVYSLTKINSEHKINLVLKENLDTLSTHYKILLETQKITAIAVYQSTIQIARVVEIMSQASTATEGEKVALRKEFHKILDKKYQILKQKGVLQYQFLFPNNISFYRAHKPSKFGDDLTDVRSDFKYTNKTKKPIRGFVQGRVAHGFRNTFPIFDKNANHIGAMEVSFSSDSFQKYLNNISGIHTHFLVNKNIFNSKTWERNDLVLDYKESAEDPNYMITLNSIHTQAECIVQNREKLKPRRKEIDLKIALGNAFSLYVRHKEHVDIMSFLPIETIDGKTAAWLVSYAEGTTIESTLFNTQVLRIITFFVSLFIVYFLGKLILAKQEIEEQKKSIEEQHRLLDTILSLTDNVMFITDFKDVKFLNNKFKELLNIKDINSFNHSNKHDLLNIFIPTDGYLNRSLLKEGETFISLLSRTDTLNRIVSILDENLEARVFNISVTKSEGRGDYLVTLSDITIMREYQVQTEKKASLDALTKIYNRSKFDEILDNEIEYQKRDTKSFCIVILDVDKFKNFNDTYGHLIGDEVLIKMAQIVGDNLRNTDIFARWGGEEFVILFKNTSLEIAKKVSEKLKDKIEENTHETAGKITASFGVTEYKIGDTRESIFKRCDTALYVAKENGRNRVEVV